MKEQSKNHGRRPKSGMRGKQGRKDSSSKRVNFDNERESKFEKDMRSSARMKDDKSNDVMWYARTPELLRAAASLPFSVTTGQKPEFVTGLAVPGVMAINWDPTVGGMEGAPINQAANSNYSFTVHANSRNYNYDPADQMKMILAGMSVFCVLAAGVRAYGVMRNFDQRDAYTPEALVTAMGFNYTDWRANLANEWFTLNELIARTAQIWIPNTMPVLNRWFWMNANVYRDGDSVKSQYYLFRQISYYKYVVGTTADLTYLECARIGNNLTFSQYVSFVEDLIAPLLASQDRGIIFGDILRAYTAEKIFAMNQITSDYAITPTYDREVLTQIENLTIAGTYPTRISEGSDGLLVETWRNATVGAINLNIPTVQVLNFHQKELPTPEQVMVATRLKSAGLYVTQYSGEPNPVYALSPAAYGTEVVESISIFGKSWANGSATVQSSQLTANYANSGANSIGFAELFRWSAFDWAPWIYTVNQPGAPTQANIELAYTTQNAYGDWDNYTYVDVKELAKMHTTALYSEFGVPTM